MPAVGRIFLEKLRDLVRPSARRPPLLLANGGAPGTPLVVTRAARRDPLALEAGGVAPSKARDTTSNRAARLPIKTEPSQMLVSLRRGDGRERASCEILAPMVPLSPAGEIASEASAGSTDGVSAFIAKVLDQLALSAWFPAAFLTAGLAVLLEFRSTKSINILTAVEKLTAHPVQVLVIMIPLLVIATVVTQAFSFEAIRALEGYWPGRGPAGLASRLMIAKHIRRKRSIIKRWHKESAKAFHAAVPRMIFSGDDVPARIAIAVEAQLSGSSAAPGLAGEELQLFVSTLQTWRDEADAWRLAKVDRLLTEYNSYPVNSRILPTRLGNLIRTTEDNLKAARGDIRSFVFRQRDKVSRRVQAQHDQFRTRLDMYCTLVFVSMSLMVIAPAVLAGRIGVAATAITIGCFAVMSAASYLAAIASASGYCTTLVQMNEAARSSDEK
jgi:hypothetical protein